MRVQLLHPFPTLRIHDMDNDVAGERGHVADMRGQVWREIGLGEKNDRRGAALARHQQVPFETTRIVVAIESHDDEDDVDIGGNDLLAGWLASRAPREGGAPREDADDDRLILWTLTNGDPVADGRQLRTTAGTMLQPSRGDGIHFAVFDVDAKDLVELDRDAPGTDVARVRPRRVRGREEVVPPDRCQRHSRLG